MRARSQRFIALVICAAAFAARAEAQAFTGVYVAAPGDVWAAASGGLLYHGGSGNWIKVPTSTTDNLNAVAGSGTRDVWAGGEHGILYHWNGTALTAMRAPVHGDVVALAVCAPNDAWAMVQSDNDQMAPAALHWNGGAWSPTRLPFAFRVSGVSGGCGNLVMVGTTFFDPKPTEVHQVGVLARLQDGSWVTSGWNGHSVDDQEVGNNGWSGVSAAGGGTMLLRGGPNNSILMMGRPGAWTRLQPSGEYESAVMTGGGPVLIRKDGFSRWSNGAWHDVSQVQPAAMSGMGMGGAMGQPDTAKLRVLAARADSIQRSIPRGQQPSPQQMQALMAISMQIGQAQGMPMGQMSPQQAQQMQMAMQQQQQQAQQMQTQSARNQALSFGEHPAVFNAGNSFYVASQGGAIMHISGDSSRVIFEQMCAINAQLAQMSPLCAAEPGVAAQPPLVAPAPPAAPGPEVPEEQAPSQQQQNRPRINIPRPRIRIP